MARDDDANRVNAIQDRIAGRYVKRLQTSIEAAMRSVAQSMPTGGRPEPGPEHFREIEDTMRALYRDITRETAASLVDQFKAGFLWLETKAEESGFYDRLFEEYMRTYGAQKVGQISDTTRRQIIRIIENGLKEGQSLDEIADDLMQQAPAIGEVRAAIIARTETHSASMYASLQSAKRSSLPLVKEWVSVEDGRVRDFGEGDGIVDDFSHRAMNGVQVPIDDAFEVPTSFGITERLMYPGDPAGSPGNIINCRCAQTYEVADDDEDRIDLEPTQRQPGGPQFRFQTIEKPKATVAALNAFVTDNDIADNVDLKGINATTLSKHMTRFLEIKERFDLDPMIAVGPANRFYRGAGRIRAMAAIYPVTDNKTGRKAIWHMPTKFATPKTWEREILNQRRNVERGTYEDQRQRTLAKPTVVSDEVRTRAAQMDASGAKWSFTVEGDHTTPDTVDARIQATIDHEFGHVIHLSNSKQPAMSQEINEFLGTHRPTATGWNTLVSKYSGQNPKEYVAETFSLYMRGDEAQFYRIHPELLAIYQRYDKLSGAKSVRLMLQGGFMDRKQTNEPGVADDISTIISAVMAADPADRDKLRKELLAAYPYDDKDSVELWLDEALALENTDSVDIA